MACNCNSKTPSVWIDHIGCLRLNIDGRKVKYCPDSETESSGISGLTFNNNTSLLTLTFSDETQDPISVNLSSLDENFYVDSVSFNEDTSLLTLTFADEAQDPISVDLSALASDFYTDSVNFDNETRTLTIQRTGGLSDLTTEIPIGVNIPPGVLPQILGFDALGNLATVTPTPNYPGGTIVMRRPVSGANAGTFDTSHGTEASAGPMTVMSRLLTEKLAAEAAVNSAKFFPIRRHPNIATPATYEAMIDSFANDCYFAVSGDRLLGEAKHNATNVNNLHINSLVPMGTVPNYLLTNIIFEDDRPVHQPLAVETSLQYVTAIHSPQNLGTAMSFVKPVNKELDQPNVDWGLPTTYPAGWPVRWEESMADKTVIIAGKRTAADSNIHGPDFSTSTLNYYGSAGEIRRADTNELVAMFPAWGPIDRWQWMMIQPSGDDVRIYNSDSDPLGTVVSLNGIPHGNFRTILGGEEKGKPVGEDVSGCGIACFFLAIFAHSDSAMPFPTTHLTARLLIPLNEYCARLNG